MVHVGIQDGRRKARSDALNLVIPGRFAFENRGCRGLDRDDMQVGKGAFEDLADAGHRAPGPDPQHEGVQVGKLSEDFLGRRLPMNFRVGRVGELLRHVIVGPACRGALGGVDRGVHAFAVFGQDEFGAVRGQQTLPFLAHGFRHGQGESVALDRGDQRQADPGIAAGRFDNRHPRTQGARPLGRLYHAEADSVFDASAGIERFEFRPHRGPAGLRNLAELNHRRVANKFEK